MGKETLLRTRSTKNALTQRLGVNLAPSRDRFQSQGDLSLRQNDQKRHPSNHPSATGVDSQFTHSIVQNADASR